MWSQKFVYGMVGAHSSVFFDSVVHPFTVVTPAAAAAPHLQQVGRQHLMSVTIVEGQSCGEAGHGDAVLDSDPN